MVCSKLLKWTTCPLLAVELNPGDISYQLLNERSFYQPTTKINRKNTTGFPTKSEVAGFFQSELN